MPNIDRACLDAVRQHLKQCFPDWAVDERWDGDREAQSFRLTKPSEPVHLLEVRRNVLDNHRPEELSVLLKYRSEEHTSELQSRLHLVCRLLLEKKKKK